jgi:hypothetical protein
MGNKTNSSTFTGTGLQQEHIKHDKDRGYLVADRLFTDTEIGEIRAEALEIFQGNRGQVDGLVSVQEHTDEADVFKNYIAIHFPHKMSAVITRYVKHEKVTDILTKIISPNVKCMQSMLFVKAPGKPGQSWHQDEYYIPTRDCSLTGVWIAVDDAAIDNGCLWVIPGSHQPAFIRQRVPYHGNEYGETDNCVLEPYGDGDAIPVEVKKGSVVFFNGYLLHSSLRNKTKDRFRMALVNHYMSGESMLPWNWDGRLPNKEDVRDFVMVAGSDPYAYKPMEDLTYPYLRPDRVHIVKE